MYVIGIPVAGPAGIGACQMFAPVFLSYACRIACPPEPSVAKRKFFVTSRCDWDGEPVGGTFFRPAASNAALIFGGVSPLGIVKAMSPLFMSYAVIRPYGGF